MPAVCGATARHRGDLLPPPFVNPLERVKCSNLEAPRGAVPNPRSRGGRKVTSGDIGRMIAGIAFSRPTRHQPGLSPQALKRIEVVCSAIGDDDDDDAMGRKPVCQHAKEEGHM